MPRPGAQRAQETDLRNKQISSVEILERSRLPTQSQCIGESRGVRPLVRPFSASDRSLPATEFWKWLYGPEMPVQTMNL